MAGGGQANGRREQAGVDGNDGLFDLKRESDGAEKERARASFWHGLGGFLFRLVVSLGGLMRPWSMDGAGDRSRRLTNAPGDSIRTVIHPNATIQPPHSDLFLCPPHSTVPFS